MSTVLRPVGPRPARVYWVRRVVVLVGLLVVALLVWGLVSALGALGVLGGGSAEPAPGAAAGTATAGPADDDAAAAAPLTDGRPGPCDPADLTVSLATPVRAYGEDQAPTFTFAVTNGGDAACTVDAGSGNLVVTVTSGEDRIWSSTDCVEAPGEQILLLDRDARHQETVQWPRERSDEPCTADLPAPRPGTYQAVATFHGAQTAAAVFELR